MRAALFVQGKAITEAMDASGATVKELLFALNKSNIYPKLKPKWDATFKQKNVYAISLTASPTKTVDAHFTSGKNAKEEKKKAVSKKVNPLLNKNINDFDKNPEGYQIVKYGNKKVIKRLDTNNPNTPQLTVDEKGKIIEYKGPKDNRISVSGKLRKILNTPKGHQAHHLVPDNVVQKSELHTLARKKGLYDLDRKDNGVNLAETIDDFDKDPTGKSKGLPLHKGSHPEWDKLTVDIIEEVEEKLIVKYGTLEKVPDAILEKTTISIEKRLAIEMNKQPHSVKLK